jgi:cell division septal protein FtsQ
MRTQEEIKEQIQKEMLELGYILLDLEGIEVIEVGELTFEARMSYYQNLSKVVLEREFKKHYKI